MVPENRRNKIKEIIMEKNFVRVADLVNLFNVSEETIRRDLTQLEKINVVKKIYGGAVFQDELRNAIDSIPSILKRKEKNFAEKDKIGQKAAEPIKSNQIIVLDAGTTTWCIARYLKKLKNMFFITNSINVANECIYSKTSSVYLPGG
ncbi:MAG TPA: DeoR/GlpR family DNA-binding transcription regulator [Atribacterota bacterium]|nr:DeoR/GlpR family DNA-binding transcription regulator [Atribacterota bacterium]